MIRLRRIEKEDLEQLRIWRNTPDIMKWCRQNDLISKPDQEKWFQFQNDEPSIKMYAIHTDEFLVGVCGLTSIDNVNRRAEFSLYIGPDHQGQGFARKALKSLLDIGFKNLGLKCVWGETFQGNPAEKLFTDIGMIKEGTRRSFYFKDGKFIDAHLYSVLDTEWKS